MKPHPTRPIVIIDDSDEDFDITSELVRSFGVANPLVRLADGKAARRWIEDANSPRPAFILLDLNLPFVGGRELLTAMRAADWLRTVPVLVTSTSNNPNDIEACYERGANSYFVKPADFYKLERTLKAICEYWLELAETPLRASSVTPFLSVHSYEKQPKQ